MWKIMSFSYHMEWKTFIEVGGNNRSSRPEVFQEKGVLKICSIFTREHPCRSAISIKLQSNFIEITLRHGCSPVNLLRIFRNFFLKTPLDGCFCNTNMHVGEKVFLQLLLLKVCKLFLFRWIKRVKYFGLYESFLHFPRKEE